jgi:hypothetical protein
MKKTDVLYMYIYMVGALSHLSQSHLWVDVTVIIVVAGYC